MRHGDSNAMPDVGSSAAEVEGILEGLRPRMRAARIRHMRLMGAVAVIPLLGVGLLTIRSGEDTQTVSLATADPAGVEEEDPPVGTDIGVTAEDERDEPPENELSDEKSPPEEQPEGDSEEPEPVEPKVHDVDLASYGLVRVELTDKGVELVEALLAEPWEIAGAEIDESGDLVVAVTDGESIKAITISEGLWDRLTVRVDDVVIPTTTTTVKPEPKPEPEPEPEPEPDPVVERIVLEVPPAGSFVAEREGENLWGGNVQVNAGFEYDIIQAEGWKVHVAFFDETTVFHGKVYIDDSGVTKTHLWTEERAGEPEPVYKWVEIPEVGAVQFKYLDGLIHVTAITPFDGFGSYVYNEVGESVKVDFEGEGQLWIVEAWAVEGTIEWSISGPGE